MTERGFWFLATGIGRCGTGYFSNVATSCHHWCSHEGLFRPDPPEETRRLLQERLDNAWWNWEGESSWLAAPYLAELNGMTIVHLVRHPKRVIDSQMRIRAFEEADGNKWRDWQLRWLPELKGKPPAEQAAMFYVKWNRMIEPYAGIRHRIEDPIEPVLDWMGIEWRGKNVYANKRYNSRSGWGPSDVDLDGLPEPIRGELRAMCEGYGYEWPA